MSAQVRCDVARMALLLLGRLNTDLYFSLGCARAMLVKQ
jgi:hypothetical protein